MASFIIALLGVVLLAASLLPPPATEREAGAATDWHMVSHPTRAIIVPGLALHPGPDAAALAASLTPAAAPASILAVALPPQATETAGETSPPGPDAPAWNP